MNLVIGNNLIGGSQILIEVEENGYFKATFLNWPDMYGQPTYVEVSTIPLLTAAVASILPMHP